MLLRSLDGRAVGLRRPVRARSQGRRDRQRLGRAGALESLQDAVDALPGARVRGVGAPVLVEERVGDDAEGMAPVIEDDDRVHEGQPEDRQAEVVRRAMGKPLPETHGIVREIAEEAAGDGRELRVAGSAIAAEIARDRLERTPALDHGSIGPQHADLDAVALEDQAGVAAEHREPRDLGRPLHAVQEEARREVPEPEVGGDRRLEVGQELLRDGHHVGRARRGGAGPTGLRADGSARVGIDGSLRCLSWKSKEPGLAGTVPLTSAQTVLLGTSGDRYAGPGPSWAVGRHQRHDHQRCRRLPSRPAVLRNHRARDLRGPAGPCQVPASGQNIGYRTGGVAQK